MVMPVSTTVTQNKAGVKMKAFRDYLDEAEGKKKPKDGEDSSKPTKDKDDFGAFDDLFAAKPDQPLANREPDRAQEPPADDATNNAPERRRASQSDTLRAAGSVQPNQRMRDLLGRMRDIDADPEDTGYPDPDQQNLPQVDVNTRNLPSVAASNLRAAGVQEPDFHKVANLPGNMSRAIRTLGKALFRSFTNTPTENIWMLGNLGGRGPNSTAEVNAVANWARENGEEVSTGDIDFDTTIPGYSAEIKQYRAGGIRWFLVRDEFGTYIYSWPESDSLDAENTAQLDAPRREQPRRLDR
jgi:hypothetical protein